MVSAMRCLGLAGVLLIAAGPAAAAEVYSTFGPADSYGSAHYAIGPISSTQNQAIAATFSAPASFTLDSFDVALSSFNGQQIRFAVHSDSTGLPGNILESVTLPVPQNSPGIVNVGFSAFDLLLAANTTYHLSLVDPSTATPIAGGWRLNSEGITGLTFSQDGGDSWATGGGTTPAFRVNAVVPEPVGGVAIMGLLASVAARRRR